MCYNIAYVMKKYGNNPQTYNAIRAIALKQKMYIFSENEYEDALIQAIDNLKPKFKEVIMLVDIEGYSYEQAAEKLKVPVGTIKSRIYNAKKELAQHLEDLL